MPKQTTSRTRKTRNSTAALDSPSVRRAGGACADCPIRDGTMHGVLRGSFVLSRLPSLARRAVVALGCNETQKRRRHAGLSSLSALETGWSRWWARRSSFARRNTAPGRIVGRAGSIAVEQQNANAGGTQRAEFYEATKPSQRTQKPLPRQKPRPDGADSRGSRGARDRQTASAQPLGTGQSNPSPVLPTPTPTASARPAPLAKATPRFGQAPTKHDTDSSGCTSCVNAHTTHAMPNARRCVSAARHRRTSRLRAPAHCGATLEKTPPAAQTRARALRGRLPSTRTRVTFPLLGEHRTAPRACNDNEDGVPEKAPKAHEKAGRSKNSQHATRHHRHTVRAGYDRRL